MASWPASSAWGEPQPLVRKDLKPVVYLMGDLAGDKESPVYAILALNEKVDALKLADGTKIERYSTVAPETSRWVHVSRGDRGGRSRPPWRRVIRGPKGRNWPPATTRLDRRTALVLAKLLRVNAGLPEGTRFGTEAQGAGQRFHGDDVQG